MRGLLLALGMTMASVAAPAASAGPQLITSPAPLPQDHSRPRIFLAGSIDMGKASDWQAEFVAALADLDVTILNPRRADWNPAWKPEAGNPQFREQVEWELRALEAADVIVLYLAPGTQSPVSLLEMGLHARSGKLVLLCPPGFWRKGNVDITAELYGVQQVDTMAALVAEVRRRAAARRR
ncbi:nucleoside 2-deoxyribosyltransferase domain-containing protein [Sphingomonas sp. ac-8]|uniref:nucleoside 2-deoxyribosyltransferase domain-containing protein n=1 Tax=Sphingomonas sp. ac-8 TaxID=3242977 RepID=UPI003A7FA5BB